MYLFVMHFLYPSTLQDNLYRVTYAYNIPSGTYLNIVHKLY